MCEAGREKTSLDVHRWIEQVQFLGAGEILLTSVDQDGTCRGPDDKLLKSLEGLLNVPLVFGGGFSTTHDVSKSLSNSYVSGIAIGASLHFDRLRIADVKSHLVSKTSIQVRSSLCNDEIDIPTLSGTNVSIIDYGMGNTQSLINAFDKLGCKSKLTNDQSILSKADIIILPGVGSFPEGMNALRVLGLDKFIRESVQSRIPLIGICLGMQLLFSKSEEFGLTHGLKFYLEMLNP